MKKISLYFGILEQTENPHFYQAPNEDKEMSIEQLWEAIAEQMKEIGVFNDNAKKDVQWLGTGNRFYQSNDMEFWFQTKDKKLVEAKMNVTFYPDFDEIFVGTVFPNWSPSNYKLLNEMYFISKNILKVTIVGSDGFAKQVTINDSHEIQFRLKRLHTTLGHFVDNFRSGKFQDITNGGVKSDLKSTLQNWKND